MEVEKPLELTWGENALREPGKVHLEWHAPCGCAFHPKPFPHVHPCGDGHKRSDLNVVTALPPSTGATHVSIAVLNRISAQFQAYWDRHPEEKERAAAHPVTEVEEYVNEIINTARWVSPVPAAGGDEDGPRSNREPHAYQEHPLYPNYCAFAVGDEDYCKREPDNAIHLNV